MKWSLSALSTFEKCAARYKFKYIERLPEPTRPAAASRGVDMHKYIEDYINGTVDGLPASLIMYQPYFDNLRQVKAMCEVKIALNEKWEVIDWESPDVWYRGILDLLHLQPPVALVKDWKTGKEYDDHYDQKEIYAIATFAAYPEIDTVKAIHVYLDLGRNTERVYARDQAAARRSFWEGRVARMSSERAYIPSPSYSCRYCAFSKEKGGPCKF